MEQVSIIMPAHNASKTIKESIESVKLQTFQNWKLFVINDCSSDDTVKIVSQYVLQDNRIILLHTDKSDGKPYLPRNIGIKAAKGRFIAFLDSDDIWLPSKLEKQLPLFEDENCAVVYSYYKKIDENGNICSKEILSPKSINYKSFLNGDCIGNLTGIYDTTKVGKVFQKPINAEDYLMWLEILKKGFIAKNTNTVEGLYRISSSSTSSNKLKSAKWNWNIYRNELKLSIFESLYHFCIYSLKGLIKFLK